MSTLVPLVPIPAPDSSPVAAVVAPAVAVSAALVSADGSDTQPPKLVDGSNPESEDDDDDDEDGEGDFDENFVLPPGVLLGLSQLVPGSEVRQRIGTSKLGIKKTSWTKEEDMILTEIVTKAGAARWSNVASYLPGRAGKQCRERWFNHLCPEVKKGSWSAEEDRIIMESVARYGTRWSKIVKLMPGRTDNAIKNRYNSAMRREKRNAKLKGDPTGVSATTLYTAGVIPGAKPGDTPQVLEPLPQKLVPIAPPVQVAPAPKQPVKRKRDLASPAEAIIPVAVAVLPTGAEVVPEGAAGDIGVPPIAVAVATVAAPAEAAAGGAVANAPSTEPPVAVPVLATKGPVLAKPSASPKPPKQAGAGKPVASPKPKASPRPANIKVGEGELDPANPKSAGKKPRSGGGRKAAGGTKAGKAALAKEAAEQFSRVQGLSPPTGLSPVQLAALLANGADAMAGGLEFSALQDLLLANSSPPAGISSAFSAGFAPIAYPQPSDQEPLSVSDSHLSDEHMSEGHISPSQQISMLLESEGMKPPEAEPQPSPFDFSGAMATPGSSMPPPPPRDVSSANKSSSGRVRKPSTKAMAAGTVATKEGNKDSASMPPPPPPKAPEEKRLSDGAILELFEQLDADQQAKHLADDAAERRTSVPAALVRAPLGAGELPTPASLGQMGVTLHDPLSAQSGQSRQSGDGNSPFNQLSPLHLSDILTAL